MGDKDFPTDSTGENHTDVPDFSNSLEPNKTELSLFIDTILEILADHRRRFVLYVLLDEASGVIEFQSLVDRVMQLERDVLREEPEEHHRKEIIADLEHWHLPVLEELGLIEFDERSETIRYWTCPHLEEWSNLVRTKELS